MYLDALSVEMVSFIHYVYFYLFAKKAKQSVLTISFDNMINSNIVSYILKFYAPYFNLLIICRFTDWKH